MIKLSILIPSTIDRSEMLYSLLIELSKQLRDCNAENEVEILTNIDNYEKTTGAKRNILLQQAKGEYIIFIDDDDWVTEYYIKELLIACESDCDCFAINGWMTTNGKNKIDWYLAKDNPNITVIKNGINVYLRTTNHITGVKREIALKGMFPEKSNAEDKEYSERINKFLKTEYLIEKPLYHYRYSTFNKSYIHI